VAELRARYDVRIEEAGEVQEGAEVEEGAVEDADEGAGR
jgi:hypothetical protein